MSDASSTDELQAAHEMVEQWFDAFVKSPAFAALTGPQQDRAGAIVNGFTEHAFKYLGSPPAAWNRADVRECCTEILPRKISAELSYFEAAAPVLSAFFRFLDRQSLLPNASALAEEVEAVESAMLRNARDPAEWGPAKHFAMAAHDAGVDLHDQDAMNLFMLRYNQERFASAFPGGSSPAASRFTAGPYEPCPCGSGRKFKFCCKSRN